MTEEIKNILFLDIETVACTAHYDQLDERLKAQWARKVSYLKNDEAWSDEEFFNRRAGIYAEFGRVITIALGFFSASEEGELTLRIKSLYSDDEKELLQRFKDLLGKFDAESLRLCAHNGKEFDFPYLSRRLLIQGLALPEALDLSGKKPWEVKHLDTMDMWKFGDWKHFTSLELLASIFGIESSKSDIDGSMVNEVYYNGNDLEKIARYCAQDVLVTAQVFLKMKGLAPIQENCVHFVQ